MRPTQIHLPSLLSEIRGQTIQTLPVAVSPVSGLISVQLPDHCTPIRIDGGDEIRLGDPLPEVRRNQRVRF